MGDLWHFGAYFSKITKMKNTLSSVEPRTWTIAILTSLMYSRNA
jgi:hypothetical protein